VQSDTVYVNWHAANKRILCTLKLRS
jgi:hypothetical protein